MTGFAPKSADFRGKLDLSLVLRWATYMPSGRFPLNRPACPPRSSPGHPNDLGNDAKPRRPPRHVSRHIHDTFQTAAGRAVQRCPHARTSPGGEQRQPNRLECCKQPSTFTRHLDVDTKGLDGHGAGGVAVTTYAPTLVDQALTSKKYVCPAVNDAVTLNCESPALLLSQATTVVPLA